MESTSKMKPMQEYQLSAEDKQDILEIAQRIGVVSLTKVLDEWVEKIKVGKFNLSNRSDLAELISNVYTRGMAAGLEVAGSIVKQPKEEEEAKNGDNND